MSIDRRMEPDAEALNQLTGHDHIVFLGVYNADPFRSKIEAWLFELDLSGTALVVADNCSTDESVDWLRTLLAKLGVPNILIENANNYGGYGNLAMNLNLFPDATWVTTLHQDDRYSYDHVQRHRMIASASGSNLGMICSEARSITPEGNSRPYPRADWLLEDSRDPVTVFLAHLKNHAYPFSGATFSQEVLRSFPIPWHSTAFPDTEIVMKMIVDFDVEFAPGVTVEYLENPDSESHSLDQKHRDFGSFLALIRVFAHPNYKRLCDLVPVELIPNFVKALSAGISQRFEDPDLMNLLNQAVLEITTQHFGTTPDLAQALLRGYVRIGDARAVEVLTVLGAHPDILESEAATATASPSESVPVRTRSRRIPAVANLIPGPIMKFVFKRFMATRLGKRMFQAWDFDWDRK